ncbi:MAG: phage holin family protein [Anaeroplasmataceae bacterium]|nr:phage holin family protein [Anaeroplasmataceae bacterium]
MTIMEYVSIPVITIICYLLGEFFKLVVLKKKRRFKYIPVIVGGIGGALGFIIYFVSPELLFNTTNPFVAVAIGIVSGLASTGGNELVKQIFKKEEAEK